MTGTALTVDAELVVERGERTYRVWSEDDRLVLDAPSLTALRALGTLRDALPPGIAPDDRLTEAGLTVELQVRRSPVASLGEGVTGDPLGRWLAGADAAVDPLGVLTAAVRALG
ncbi:hypothetical protein I7X12_14725 [Halosimplex litoreum]|uniref:Uncharacterized protein n=1 Tax=Halosimplex litoreum TaxID=1198301 RepID=A0A7T3FWN1_9EURY|nr:hypothetical protein [Halosimplex litoreum]QPV61997.1 hypothetical protein I7X12_14725 [Halosimplex litoreum]